MKKIFILFLIIITLIVPLPKKEQKVRFTSYYPYDPTGSSECTASLLCIKDFELNEDNIYVYENKIVIATANKKCTLSNEGVCADFNEIPEGYNEYDLFDTLKIKYNNKTHDAIVLDICGACYRKEEYQRYDIFVKNEDAIVDTTGKVIIKSKYGNIIIVLKNIILIVSVFILIHGKKRKKKRKINRQRH